MNTDKPSRTEIKHEAILMAAKKVFLTQGYSLASMDEIASTASVSKRTVYDHFKTKKALFESMLNTHWQTVSVSHRQLFTEKDTISVQLTQFARTFLKFLYQEDTIALFRLLIAETNQFPDLTSDVVIADKAPFTRLLAQFLTMKKSSGELSIDSPERSAAYFIGMLKEYHFWPMMLGFTKQKQLSHQNNLIDDVVRVFLKVYQPSALHNETPLPKRKLKK